MATRGQSCKQRINNSRSPRLEREKSSLSRQCVMTSCLGRTASRPTFLPILEARTRYLAPMLTTYVLARFSFLLHLRLLTTSAHIQNRRWCLCLPLDHLCIRLMVVSGIWGNLLLLLPVLNKSACGNKIPQHPQASHGIHSTSFPP